MNFNKSILTHVILFVLFFASSSSFAQYFWVGGTGDWNEYETHWATTSGGSTFHSSAPSVNDDVFFDSNSFSAIGQVVNFSSTENYCNSFSSSGTLYSPLFQMPISNKLIVNGSFLATNEASYNFSTISMESSNSGNNINTNGESLGSDSNFHIDGTGEFNLSGELSVNNFYVYQGTVNTNDYSIYVSFTIGTQGDLSKSINLGSSEIDCEIWSTNGSNNTINAGSSIIYTQQIYLDNNNSGPYNYATVKLKESGFNTGTISGSGNIETINATLMTGYPVVFTPGATIGVEDILTSEDIHDPLNIELNINTDTEFVTLVKSSGSINLSYVEMKNIHATGGANFNLNPGVDHGNNDGWNITPITPINYYWINNTGDWADVTHWSSNSGGSADMTDFPSRYDHVLFDENSFTMSNQEISSEPGFVIKANNLSWSESVNSPIFNAQYLDIYGDFILSDAVTMNLGFLEMYSVDSALLQTSSQGSIESISVSGTGEINLDSEINAEILRVNSGTLNTNDNSISLSNSMLIWFGNDKIINFGSSEVDTDVFSVHCYSCDVNAEDLVLTVHSEIRGGQDNFYNHLIIDGPTNVIHSNTFNTLEIIPGSTPSFNDGSELTIINDLILNGTPSQPINISSSSPGSPFSFIKTSGTVNGSYLILQDNIATGGATFNALQSVENGGVSGWNIEALQPLDYYWVGNGGNWTDNANHWATTSGGSIYHPYPPGSLDNVYFDYNSFSSNNQIVVIDQENIYCHSLDWSDVTNTPAFEGEDKIINCTGNFILNENMTANISEVVFTGTGTYDINTAFDDSPGENTSFTFNDAGTWNVLSPLKLENLTIDAGLVNTNDNDINCELYFQFRTDQPKEIHLGTSTVSTRNFGYQIGTNGIIDGSESDIHIFGSINPIPYDGGLGTEVLDLNNLFLGNSTEINTTNLVKEIWGSFEVNELTFEPGIEVSIQAEEVVTVNQLIAQGNSSEHIILRSHITGVQGTIHQASGTVDGQYLELQDAAATGNADFYANNSIDVGNVTGWIFTNVQQSINFPVIDDVMEDIGTITLDATASSGLAVSYVIDYGPATVEGNVVTITDAGEIQITASQNGDGEYAAAASQTNTFCSTPLTPIISSEEFEDHVTLTANDAQLCIWFRNEVLFENVPTTSIDVTQTGNYTAQRTTTNNCDSDFSNEINVSVISIEEFDGHQTLDFFPNPAKDNITILLPENGKFEISIYDVYGKLVLQSSNTEIINNESIIDIQHLAKDVYFILIITENSTYSNTLIKE